MVAKVAWVYVPITFTPGYGPTVEDADGLPVPDGPTGPLTAVGDEPGRARLCLRAVELAVAGDGRSQVRLPNGEECWMWPGPERRHDPLADMLRQRAPRAVAARRDGPPNPGAPVPVAA